MLLLIPWLINHISCSLVLWRWKTSVLPTNGSTGWKVLQIQRLHGSVLGGNWNMLPLSYMIIAFLFLDYIIPPSSHLPDSVASMDVLNLSWLFYPTLKVSLSGKISWIKWSLYGLVDCWSETCIWLLMLLLMAIIRLGSSCRLENYQDFLSTRELKF